MSLASLVDGRLEEEEVPDFGHDLIVTWLVQQFRNWLAGRGGFVGGSEAKFAVRKQRGRKPDLPVLLPGTPPPPRRGLVRVPPDIAVEVVSATPRDGRCDRVEKVAEYAEFGIRWYWIVDQELRSLEILARNDSGLYEHALGATEGGVDAIPGCPGLSFDLSELWAELDRLGAEEPGPA